MVDRFAKVELGYLKMMTWCVEGLSTIGNVISAVIFISSLGDSPRGAVCGQSPLKSFRGYGGNEILSRLEVCQLLFENPQNEMFYIGKVKWAPG